jgi:hypothetical protein
VTVSFDEYRRPESLIKKSAAVTDGDTLKVRLPSQALGYHWRMTAPAASTLVRIVREKDRGRPEKDRDLPDSDAEQETNQPGGREFRVFRFRVERAASIEFRHVHAGTKRHDKVVQIKVTLTGRPSGSDPQDHGAKHQSEG